MKSKSPILDGAMERMKADHCLPTTISDKAANVQPLKPQLDDSPGLFLPVSVERSNSGTRMRRGPRSDFEGKRRCIVKQFIALYYFRDATGQLRDRFMPFEAASMAAAKRHGKAEKGQDERLVYVELAAPGINCPP